MNTLLRYGVIRVTEKGVEDGKIKKQEFQSHLPDKAYQKRGWVSIDGG